MGNRFLIILGVILVGFVGLVTINKIAAPAEPISTGSSNFIGKMDSPVTFTEYVDFQCEACYAFYPTIKEVKEIYKDKVKFQIRYFPITSGHQYAKMAASYAESAARQGKFFEMHDKLFEGQKTWESSQKPNEYFDKYAQELKLNMAKLKTDLESKEVSAVINADLKEVKRIGGTGTPTFAINGEKIDSPKNSVEDVSKIIDDALKKNQQ